MSTSGVATRVEAVIQRRLGVASEVFEPSMRLVDDLGADSLALVELTLSLEEEFDIDIAEDDIEGLWTVQDAVSYVDRCLALQPQATGRT